MPPSPIHRSDSVSMNLSIKPFFNTTVPFLTADWSTDMPFSDHFEYRNDKEFRVPNSVPFLFKQNVLLKGNVFSGGFEKETLKLRNRTVKGRFLASIRPFDLADSLRPCPSTPSQSTAWHFLFWAIEFRLIVWTDADYWFLAPDSDSFNFMCFVLS